MAEERTIDLGIVGLTDAVEIGRGASRLSTARSSLPLTDLWP